MGENFKNIQLTITGRVQGVGFRYSTIQKANELDVKGFVKNQYDGSVFIEAEGDNADLDRFILWCKEGPRMARVDHVSQSPGTIKNHTTFSAKH